MRVLGHEPMGPVADGQLAVEAARASPPDLYLFDIDMPRLDGLAAAATLAAEGLRRPVVVVTGVEDPDLIDRSIASGVGDYLMKPIDERELDAAIRLAAARHAEFAALEADVSRAQQALEDRKLIERAKGLLMTALAIPEPDAFRRIQVAARERNLRLEVARQIIEQRSLLEQSASQTSITRRRRPEGVSCFNQLRAALYDLVLARSERAGLAACRVQLLAQARGRALEIGAGTGLNLRHYPRPTELTLTEPDAAMRTRLRTRARCLGVAVKIVDAQAERLPFPDRARAKLEPSGSTQPALASPTCA